MICDKCGFEHNSKSVCPKCGARVVYVNEDYEKRRQAYLEAQKQGKTPDLPPGILHSTEDEHNLRTGKDRAPSRYHEEEHGKEISTVVAEGLEKALTGLAGVIVFFRKKFRKLKKKMKKKRGANNPVMNKLTFDDERKLTFDDGKETLDTSKLVLDHKKFMDRRIPIFFGCLAGAAAVTGLIVLAIVYANTDHTAVWLYGPLADGSAIYRLNREDKSLWQGPALSSDELIAYTEDASYVYVLSQNKLTRTHEGLNSTVILDEEAEYSSLTIDESGTFCVITGCIREETETTGEVVTDEGLALGHESQESTATDDEYIMLLWQEGSDPIELCRDEYSRSALAVTEDYIIYEKSQNGAYGVVSAQTLELYSYAAGRSYTLASDYSDYELNAGASALYYVKDSELYLVELATRETEFLEDGVTLIAEDALDAYEGVIYEKNSAYYCLEQVGDEGTKLLSSRMEDLTFYYYPEEKYLCLYEPSGSGGRLYVLSLTGNEIPSLDSAEEGYEVLQVLPVDNDTGLLYVTEQGMVVLEVGKNGVTRLGLDASVTSVRSVLRTKKTFAVLGTDNVLMRFDLKGATLGDVSAYAAWIVSK